MRSIVELDRHVADLIAAGEVVERPASVVKELIENSADAGASSITVEIKRGGLEMIRITDDGHGIAPEDIRTAFLRHATSKIRSAEDLGSISTMGFRGEALPSVAAVSKVSLFSRTGESISGIHFELEGGVETAYREAGCPQGTTVIVRELFFNTPARMKFIKRDVTEANQVRAVVRRAALSNPDISFKFINDGEETIHTPGDNNLKSAIYCVYGSDFTRGLEQIRHDHEGISVFGYVSKPSYSMGNRTKQEFYVNRRPIRSRLLGAALEEAYKNKIMVNRFPGCVLHIEVAPALLDVNVHPSKSEVKFAFDKQVFDAVYIAVKDAVEKGDARAEIVQTPKGSDSFFKSMQADEYRNISYMQVDTGAQYSAQRHYSPAGNQSFDRAYDTKRSADTTRDDIAVHDTGASNISGGEPALGGPPTWKIVGEAFGSYIIVEDGDDILFIDKHAAHERIIYERLLKEDSKPMAQMLMEPLLVHSDRDEYEILLENREMLIDMGFDLDDFGDGSIIFRALPDQISRDDAEASLQEIAQMLIENRRGDIGKRREEALMLVACKAALKAGSISSEPEKYALVKEVIKFDDIKYCPHGRPVAALVKRSEIERRLGRI